MKRIFILVTVLAVIAAGCKNYDDRFDDLNGQIATLTTQVQALQGVATQVTALNTEIGNIRSSIQEDIRTAVAGVSTTLNTSLTNAQTTLNGEIAKLQTALNDAAENSLSQKDIAKLKSDLQTTLAAAQKTALETALASLQAKLTELETALATAASGALSQADLDKLKEEIETQLAQVKKDLEESLGEGGFHSGEVTINSSGSWEFTKRQLSDKTEFSGNFTIDTGSLTDAEVDELIGWVAEITLINGDLTITHKDKDKVIKFAKLSSVTNLDDRQPHAHYPELTGVLEVSLSGEHFKETLSVKLPKITKTTFKDGQIGLPKLEQGDDDNGFDLSSLASYEGDLTIQTNDKVDILLNALASIDAENNGGTGRDKKLLTIDGGKNVHLDVLASVKGLIIEDVKHLEAPIVQEAELTIKGDVISVDIATGEGDKVHIKKLTIDEAGELKTLKFRGKSDLKDVVFRDTTTGDLETLEIHGLESVRLVNLDELESLTTAGIIKSLTINNSSLEDELILGHESGDNGVLRVLNNADITSLEADKVNKLKTLIIQGNSKLESLSFLELKAAGTQTFGSGSKWYEKDAIIIGAYNQAGGYTFEEDLANHLVAKAFLPKIKAGTNKNTHPEIPGNIEDDKTGLEGLKDFLKSATRAIVSYDSAEEYSTDRNEDDAKERAEGEEAPTDGSNLILFRKGLADQAGSSIAAKRVFVISKPVPASPGTITIGLRGGISRVVTLTTGGSLNNWVRDINDQEVKDFFDVNEIDIEATKGAVPSGNIRFDTGALGTVTQAQDDDDIDNDLGGYLKLTIGEYSHEVHLTDGSEDDIAFARNRKAAKTYLDTDNSSEFVDLQGLLNTLAQAFPAHTQSSSTTVNRGITDGKGITPYGVNDYDGSNGYLSYGTLDPSPIDKPITVTFENKLSQDDLLALVDDDADTNIKNGDYLVITLTSQKPGAEDSTIGQPTEAEGPNSYLLAGIVRDTPENQGQAYVDSSERGENELSVGNILRKASAPVKGVDDQGKTTTRPGKDIDLFGDL